VQHDLSNQIYFILIQFGVTHTDSSLKSSVTIRWTAPPEDTGPIVFRWAQS